MIRVRAVRPLDDYRVLLTFTDGSERAVDLTPYLRGPIFDPIRAERQIFDSVGVDPELGTIVWPNGADVEPRAMQPAGRRSTEPLPRRRRRIQAGGRRRR